MPLIILALVIFASILNMLGIAWGMGAPPPPSPPISMPFAAHKKGETIDIQFQIKEHRRYAFRLEFFFKADSEEDWRRVGQLITERPPNTPGAGFRKLTNQIFLSLKITNLSSKEASQIADLYIDDYVSSADGGRSLGRDIAFIILKPGLYRVQVRSLRDVPALASVPIKFEIGWYPKTSPILD